jgi:hypothetical protein
MKGKILLSLIVILTSTLYSCTKPKGIWDDNIHLSTKTAEFSASGDSVIIKTVGSSWWISDISVQGVWYFSFPGVNLQADSYSIKQDCLTIEHRDKNTLFIKAEANPDTVKRIITVGLSAGDYHDRVIITQKSN